MDGIKLNYSKSISPIPTSDWIKLSVDKRIHLIKNCFNNIDPEWEEKLNISKVTNNGFVELEFKKSLPVNDRSNYLLKLETNLCNEIDPAITIWMSPVGDKSSLRNLRGIEVKNL